LVVFGLEFGYLILIEIFYRFLHLLALSLQLLLVFQRLFDLIQFFSDPSIERLQSSIIFIVYKLIFLVAHQLCRTLIKLQGFALQLRRRTVVNAGVTVTRHHPQG
jgi:hypothetical protein